MSRTIYLKSEAAVMSVSKPLTDPAVFNGSVSDVKNWLTGIAAEDHHKYLIWISDTNDYIHVDAFFSIVGNTETTGEDNETVDHPKHYNTYKFEVIELVEDMNFNRGNAVKYIARAGIKNAETEIEDLKKAAWYINREIQRLESIKKT